MDSEGLRMLHVFMLDYMRQMNMNQSAEIFAREAGVDVTSFGFNPPDGFLVDWWTIFWHFYTERMYDQFDQTGIVIESSIPVEANAQPQVLALTQAQAQIEALAQAQAHVEAQAQAEALAYAQAQSHALQVQAQIQSHTYNDMGTNNSYVYTMGQTSNQVFPFHGNTESILTQPILGARGNDEQYGVLSSYMNVGVEGGWTLPEHSSNPRHYMHTMGRSPQQSLHRVNRRGNQTVRGAASNPTSQRSMRIMNSTTRQPLNTDLLDLNSILEYFNMH